MRVCSWLFFSFAVVAVARGSAGDYIEPYVASNNFSGAVLIAKGSRTVLDRAYGFSNLEHRVRATTGTRFGIASLSKMFTAASVLQLRDGGRLTLDDPLGRYVAGIPNGDRITIRMLLMHRSGLRQDTADPDYFSAATHPYTLEEAVARIATLTPIAEPGVRRNYANPNYVLLAMVVQRVSGERYGEYLERHLFQPLRMTHTTLNDSSADILPGRAQGYSPIGERELQNARPYESSIGTGAGSAWGTTADLRRWMDGLSNHNVLSPASVDEMLGSDHEPQGFVGAPIDVVGHRGVELTGWDGVAFSSTVILVPSTGLLTVVLSNRNVGAVASKLAETLARVESGGHIPKLALDRKPLPASFLERVTGRYRLGPDFYVPNTVLEIVACGRFLCERQNTGKLVGLLRTADGDFIHRSSWGRVVFELDGSGRAHGLQFFDRFRATRIDE